MKPRTSKERKALLWLGWLLISLTLLLWSILILAILFGPEDATFIAVGGLIFSSVLIAIGIFCVKLGIATSPSRLELGFEHAERIEPSMRDREGEPRKVGKAADKLCTRFLTLGIDAQKLRKHPLEEAGLWGVLTRERHGSIYQVAGKNIKYVNVIKHSGGQYDPPGTTYQLDFLVPLRDTPSRLCRAKLGTKRKSLWSTEIVDIEWKGETLADKLNGDLSLKQRLLEEVRLNGWFEVKITPWPAYQSARLETAIPGEGFDRLSRNMFDCLDRIAARVFEVNNLSEEVDNKSTGIA